MGGKINSGLSGGGHYTYELYGLFKILCNIANKLEGLVISSFYEKL